MSTATDVVIRELKELLQQHPDVAQWSILQQETREWQHYMLQQQAEATREVTNEVYQVTLYHLHPHPDGSGEMAMGMATISLTAWDREQMREKVEEGLFIASLTNNRPWSLPAQAVFPDVPLADLDTLQDPIAVIELFQARLQAALQKEERVRLSAAELFFEEKRLTLHNSEGVYGQQHETTCMLELNLLATADEGAETEHFVTERARCLADLQVEEIVANNAASARDSLTALLPQTWSGPVVLSSDLLPELFEPIGFRASAMAAYSKISTAKIGESFLGEQDVRGEALNLAYSSAVPFGVHSYSFDAEGLPGQEVTVVQDNVLIHYLAAQRFADYLGVPATGTKGNLILRTGQASDAEMFAGPVYYILAFSSVMPNPFTGDFACEIKLGYRIDEQGNPTPIKGGSISGNLYDALANARYSAEEVATQSYRGPKAVRFEHLTIAGE